MDENMKEILKRSDSSNESSEHVTLDEENFDENNDVVLDTELNHGNGKKIEQPAFNENTPEKNNENEKETLNKNGSSNDTMDPVAGYEEKLNEIDDIKMDVELNQSNVKKIKISEKEEISEKKDEDSDEIYKNSVNETAEKAASEKEDKIDSFVDINEPDDVNEIEYKESARLFKLDKNLQFYKGEIASKPEGGYIDEILNNWSSDYDLLENHHGYIQWLFPNVDPGMNFHSQPLQQEELEIMKNDQEIVNKMLSSFRMMLNFYGMKIDQKNLVIKRSKEYRKRYDNLKKNRHNFLRLTRILNCLAEFELVDYQYAWIQFLIKEIYSEKKLGILERSMENFFVQTIKNDEKRNEFMKKIEEYKKSK
ncbi:dentin sialophospho -like isoform X1 [Brachionus plicatilis]|uniref:Dentin sialophospho-like isoform X1 n=1 Tax=Brachionus plicatilis TaxID=10195 RepID=A0A3M7REN4_BRAPC|nr:dentin sialophospho -like isoform X1 [Brachionus plicatilis]